MVGTQDSVEVSWEKLSVLLDRVANELLRRLGYPSVESGSSGLIFGTSKQRTNVIRGAVAHVLIHKANSAQKLSSNVDKALDTYKDDIDGFIRYCAEVSITVGEHRTLQEIRLGRRRNKSGRVNQGSVSYIVQFISGTLGERIDLSELLVPAHDGENGHGFNPGITPSLDGLVSERVNSKGENSKAAFDSLVRSFEQWPELAKEMRLLDESAVNPVHFLLSKKCLNEMIKGPLYYAVKNCLERDLKIGNEVFLAHEEVSLDILGSLCVFELSSDWLSRAGAAIDDNESVLEVSVKSTFGVEVVRVGRWGGMAKFVRIKVQKIPVGEHAIMIDPHANECGSSTNVAVEHILQCVWSKVLPENDPPASFLLPEAEFQLETLRGAIDSSRVRHIYHHISQDVRNNSVMAVPGVREALATLIRNLHVVIWGVRNDAGFPVFLGDEAFTLNSVANFLLISEDVKRKVNPQ